VGLSCHHTCMDDKKLEFHGIFFVPPITENFIGHQCSEIWRDNVYAPFLQGKSGLTIVDLGSNIGLTTYYFSQFADKVYSVEPSKEHFQTLTRMLTFNNIQNVVPINKAIYIKSGKLSLYHDVKNKTMYSLHSAIGSANKFISEEVEAITLGELFKEHDIKHVDFMKCDIEGSETELLSSTSFMDVADKISTIVVERHDWAGRQPQQLVDALKNAGFNVGQVSTSADLLVGTK